MIKHVEINMQYLRHCYLLDKIVELLVWLLAEIIVPVRFNDILLLHVQLSSDSISVTSVCKSPGSMIWSHLFFTLFPLGLQTQRPKKLTKSPVKFKEVSFLAVRLKLRTQNVIYDIPIEGHKNACKNLEFWREGFVTCSYVPEQLNWHYLPASPPV